MLHFDIDIRELDRVVAALGATEKQVKFALNRAAQRTATALRTLAGRYLKDELALRTIGLLRKRLKSIRLRSVREDGFVLWFGLNDMPVSWFKGRPTKEAGGAKFRDKSFAGGFIAKSKVKGRRTVFKREGAARLPIIEQQMPIMDRAQVVIEDEIFVQAETIFWRNFERDLRARMAYGVGNRNDRYS